MPVTYIPKKQQQEALNWVVDQLYDHYNWLVTNETRQKYDMSGNVFGGMFEKRMPSAVISGIFEPFRLLGIIEGNRAKESTGYRLEEFIDDATKTLFRNTYAGKNLDESAMAVEDAALGVLMSYYVAPQTLGSKKRLALIESVKEEMQKSDPSNTCSCTGLKDDVSFFRANMMPNVPDTYEVSPLMTLKVQELRELYKRRARSTSDKTTKAFYMSWERRFAEALDNK